MVRAFFLLTGFGIAVSGGISIIAYLNLFAAGLDINGYIDYIAARPECYLLPAGIGIILLSIFLPGGTDGEE